jgi:hypothetical protein
MKWFYVDFYHAHILSIAALKLTTLFWTLMTIFDFRHVPTLLPPYHIEMHMCIHISSPSHLDVCEYAHAKGLVPNYWNPILGHGTGVWSVILARHVLLPLEEILQPFFSDQFFSDRVL